MKDINWLIRIRNKAWWLAMVPAVAILIQAVLQVFGISWDYTLVVGKFAACVEAVFAVLALMGVSVDPTTSGIVDSSRALGYTEPAPNCHETGE